MKRRILSWVLVLCMVLALLPGGALAAEESDAAAPTVEELYSIFENYGFSAVLAGQHYFESGTAPSDEAVFWYMQTSGVLNDCLDQETWYYTLSYDRYIALVDSLFTHHSDMMEYMTKNGYYNEETGELHWYSGGIGDFWEWVPLTIYETDDAYKVQGLFLYGLPSDLAEDAREYYDYYVYHGSNVDQNGEIHTFSREMPIDAVVQLTVAKDTDGVWKIDAYTENNYYIITGEETEYGLKDATLYVRENGEVTGVYSRMQLEEAQGTTFVTEDGAPLTSILTTFADNDDYWYVSDQPLTFDVAVDAGYKLTTVMLATPTAGGSWIDTPYTIEEGSGAVILTTYGERDMIEVDGVTYAPLTINTAHTTLTITGGATELEGYDGYWFKQADCITFTVTPDEYYDIFHISGSTGTLNEPDAAGQAYQYFPDFGPSTIHAYAKPTYTITDDVLTYDDPELGSTYLLTFDLDDNVTCLGLVYGASDTTKSTELVENPDSTSGDGYDYYLWPDSSTYLTFSVPEGYCLGDFVLEPADAGTLIQISGSTIAQLRLNAPATLHIRSATQVVKTSASGATLTAPAEHAQWFYGLELSVEPVSDSADENLIVSTVGEDHQVALYDIHLAGPDDVLSPVDVPMTITLPIPEGWDAAATSVYFVDSKTDTVTDLKGTVSEDGKTISFTTTHFSHYALVQKRVSIDPTTVFTDVSHDWAYPGIEYCYNHGLMAGIGNGRFDPNGATTRAMVVAILWRQAGSPAATTACSFTDLKEDWYQEAVAWAAENGIVAGRNAAVFDPDTAISRQEMTAILYRYVKNWMQYDMSNTADLTVFPDSAQVDSYAVTAMAWAKGVGLITGNKIGGTIYLDPKGAATRAQAATIFMNLCEKVL